MSRLIGVKFECVNYNKCKSLWYIKAQLHIKVKYATCVSPQRLVLWWYVTQILVIFILAYYLE